MLSIISLPFGLSLKAIVIAAFIIWAIDFFFSIAKPSILVYDVETIQQINDMGEKSHQVVMIGYYDYRSGKYQADIYPDFNRFQRLAKKRKTIVGFNSISFDDKVCDENGILVNTTYDIYQRARLAAKQQAGHGKLAGYNLDILSKTNLGEGKIGTGGNAERLWAKQDIEALTSYCLKDVELTKRLYDKRKRLKDPNARVFWVRLNLDKVIVNPVG